MPVFLVPRRAGDPMRDRLWDFCRAWWSEHFPDWPIIEGSHTEGPFNRGAAINHAATVGGWDVAIVADADVMCDPTQLYKAVERCRATDRVTLPYTEYRGLARQMTEQILRGFDGDWERGATLRMKSHVSSLLVVPRQLWDAGVRFDERFVGWGYDDNAFISVARVLGGGVERVDGKVWHLWHIDSPERDKTRPELKAAAALAQRYNSTLDIAAMRDLVLERDTPDGVCLVVVTNGRRECIGRAIASADRHLFGRSLPITRAIVCDDSGDVDYQAWLRRTFRAVDFDLICGQKPQGYGRAMATARQAALESGQRWIFWLEDDFTIDQPVPLDAMAMLLEQHPQLCQVVLRRQPYFPAELAAGGILERFTNGTVEEHETDWCPPGSRHTYPQRWLEHRLFWSMNPHLVERTTLARYPWPTGAGSEVTMHKLLQRDQRSYAYWGARDDEPWCTHDGERVGHGY